MSTSFKEEEGDKAVEILLYPGPSPSRKLLSKETDLTHISLPMNTTQYFAFLS